MTSSSPSERYRLRERLVGACRLVAIVALALLPLVVDNATAGWGPSPVRVLAGGAETVLAPVEGDFVAELREIAKDAPLTPFRPSRHGDDMAADLADVSAALESAGLSDEQRAAALASYEPVRRAIAGYPSLLMEWRCGWHCAANRAEREAKRKDPGPEPQLPADTALETISKAIPEEFRDYSRGALLFRRGDLAGARAVWLTLLERPAADRRYRSTWSAFMVGRTWLGTDDTRARDSFRKVRELAAAGFPDSNGLAFASLGMEAYAELRFHALDRALELYLTQYAVDPEATEVSMRLASERLRGASKEELQRIASRKGTRRIATAYLLSAWTPPWQRDATRTAEGARALLEAIEAAGVEAEEAGRLATAAYHEGQFALARRWAALAPKDEPYAQWIEAKLLARDGKIPQAAALMTKVAGLLRDRLASVEDMGVALHPYHRVERFLPAGAAAADLGAFRFAAQDFTGALQAFVESNSWLDAAYVAEKVLDVDELRSATKLIVERGPRSIDCPRDCASYHLEGHDPWPEELARVLVRRELREGRLDWAREDIAYGCRRKPSWCSLVDGFVRSLTEGRDPARSPVERATSLMNAAHMVYLSGEQLLATEGDPDWAMFGVADQGSLHEAGELPVSTWQFRAITTRELPRSRTGKLPAAGWWIEPAAPREEWGEKPVRVDFGSPFHLPSAAERERVKRHPVEPNQPLHWMPAARDLVREAARLLPEGSELRAQHLHAGASWFAPDYPALATELFDELQRCCRDTALGKEATVESLGIEQAPADGY